MSYVIVTVIAAGVNSAAILCHRHNSNPPTFVSDRNAHTSPPRSRALSEPPVLRVFLPGRVPPFSVPLPLTVKNLTKLFLSFFVIFYLFISSQTRVSGFSGVVSLFHGCRGARVFHFPHAGFPHLGRSVGLLTVCRSVLRRSCCTDLKRNSDRAEEIPL